MYKQVRKNDFAGMNKLVLSYMRIWFLHMYSNIGKWLMQNKKIIVSLPWDLTNLLRIYKFISGKRITFKKQKLIHMCLACMYKLNFILLVICNGSCSWPRILTCSYSRINGFYVKRNNNYRFVPNEVDLSPLDIPAFPWFLL